MISKEGEERWGARGADGGTRERSDEQGRGLQWSLYSAERRA